MSAPKVAIEGVSIVLVGSFNPAIFHPAWFAAQKLISAEEADDAKIELIVPEVAAFALEWMNIQVLHERFIASTAQAPSFEVLRDLVIGTFTVLQHTPVRMLGLNFDRHFEMESEEAWHGIGRRLAPPDLWAPALREPGLLSLTMHGARPDSMPGSIRAKVEPSAKVQFGVYVNINDHYDIEPADETEIVTATRAVEIIQEKWSDFLKWPEEVANAIFGDTA